MADYWLKLYIEILDDPKMATLPDRLWRRVVELFLVAKKLSKDGHLPDTRQIAWLLRMNADDLEHDLSQIATTGIVIREVNGWFIPNFVKRQAAVPDVERKAQERIRKKSQQYYGDVTNASRNVTQSTELRVQSTETETEAEEESNSSLFPQLPEIALYTEVTGLIPDVVTEQKVIEKIRAIRAFHKSPPHDRLVEIMTAKFSLWKSSKTKDGRPYNPSNPDWLDWCVTGYDPTITAPKKVRKLTGANGQVIEVPA